MWRQSRLQVTIARTWFFKVKNEVNHDLILSPLFLLVGTRGVDSLVETYPSWSFQQYHCVLLLVLQGPGPAHIGNIAWHAGQCIHASLFVRLRSHIERMRIQPHFGRSRGGECRRSWCGIDWQACPLRLKSLDSHNFVAMYKNIYIYIYVYIHIQIHT